MLIAQIDNPSEAVQLAAIRRRADNIKYIKNPTELIQLAAIKQQHDTIRRIKDPSLKAQKYAFMKYNGAIIDCIVLKTNISKDLIEKYKPFIIKHLIELLMESEPDVQYIFDIIANLILYYNINWTELHVIKDSLATDHNDELF